MYEGAHEGIVSVEEWEAAQRKRKATGGKWEKIYHPNREHLLSGLLRCPICGAGMYGNVNRKKKKDGTFYQDYYYYACKHRLGVDGHRCDYNRQWKQEKINAAVEEVILKLVNNPRFEAAIKEKIGSKIDTGELEKELENLQKKLRQLQGAKTKLGKQIDSLDISDKHYDRKYEDMQTRLDKLYDEIDAVDTRKGRGILVNQIIRSATSVGANIHEANYASSKADFINKFHIVLKKKQLPNFYRNAALFEECFPNPSLPQRATRRNAMSDITEHDMKLHPAPFEMIKSGQKTIELRLFDEKRQRIKVGDRIVFTNSANGETLKTTVAKLHWFDSFEELYRSLPLLQCGYTTEDIDTATSADMEKYYSSEEQKKYGVVGIELSLQKE